MVAARRWLSAFRVPSTRIASPFERTTSRMNLFDGWILSRSVHHRNLFRGAGYPLPIRLTQNVSSTSGVSLCGTIGSPCSPAAVLILASDASTQAATSGCSTSVSVEMTWIVLVRSAGGKLADRQPDQLQRRARILAAAVADDPGDAIVEIEAANLVAPSPERGRRIRNLEKAERAATLEAPRRRRCE